MKVSLDDADLLIKNGKHKKALTLLKKINKKSPNYHSLDLEGFCLYQNKQYQLAILRYQDAIKLNPPTKEHANILVNLAACHVKLAEMDNALLALKQSIDIEPSINNAQCRMQLGELATESQAFDLVLEYLPKLLGMSEYATNALLLLLNASLATNNQDAIASFSAKVLSECTVYSSVEASHLLKMLQHYQSVNLAHEVLAQLKPKHAHERWFIEYTVLFDKKDNVKTQMPQPPKSRVVGANTRLIDSVHQLLADNEAQGAHFHESVRIFEDNGNLSIKAFTHNVENERLLDIPLTCMPIMSDYEFSLNTKDHIQIENKNNMINSTAQNTMRLLIDIYNQTNKISSWKEVCPYFALHNQPKLLNKLLEGKKHTAKVVNFVNLLSSGQLAKLAIESFFGSRTFTYTQESLLSAKIYTESSSELGLLSIIDFLNHRVHATNYENKEGRLFVSGQPDEESQELFVHYNNFDPLLTYLIYGFVDTSAPWLFNVPMTIKCTNSVSIDILGNAGRTEAGTYTKNGDSLAEYLPNINKLSDEHFVVDKIVIPKSSHAYLLRESLTVLVKSIDHAEEFTTDTLLLNEVTHLEEQLIRMNMAYWRELAMLNTENVNDIKILTSFAEKHLQSYANNYGILLF